MLGKFLLTIGLLSFSPLAQAEMADEPELTPNVVSAEAGSPAGSSVGTMKRFGLGLGAGYQVYGGNLGKLYDNNAIVDLRGNFFVSRNFALVGGMELGGARFDADPVGPTNITETKLKAGGRVDFLGRREMGFSPYASAVLHHSFRSQTYQRFGMVQKDTAFGWNLAAGAEYFVVPHTAAIFAEANMGRTLYKDRFEQTFLESGVEDATGATYAGILGVQMVF